MSKIGLDKVLHFVVAFCIAAVVELFFFGVEGTSKLVAGCAGLIVATYAGVFKEAWDYTHDGKFSVGDLVADILGALCAFGCCFGM